MRDDNIGCLEVIGLFLAFGLVFLLAWTVASSGLPDWMKFFLLK